MTTIFTLFRETDYTYCQLSRGNVFGNLIKSSKQLKGIFKNRKGYTRNANIENYGSVMPTMHAHIEDFATDDPIVGNGIIVNGVQYEIVDITYGKDFNTGITEFVKMTLKEANYGSK